MNRLATRDRAEDGFVLVGVIMLTLALTILGLSLFSLSGYESQFLNNSIDESQSFYFAVGGVDRAKFALARTKRLDSVKASLPPGVTYARAIQDTGGIDSIGIWKSDVPITIRVLSEWRRGRRMIEVSYIPHDPDNYYKNLFSISSKDSDAVKAVAIHPGGWNATNGTILSGTVQQTSSNQGWLGNVSPVSTIQMKPGAVIRPDIGPSWWNLYDNYDEASPLGHAPEAPESPKFTYTLQAPVGADYKVFRRPVDKGRDPTRWSLSIGNPGDPGDPAPATPRVTIRVGGKIIWLFREGFTSSRPVDVVPILGAAPPVLVLVGRGSDSTSAYDPNSGFAFNGGLNSPLVPIIMVSNERIAIGHEYHADQSSLCTYLSVYSRKIEILGANPPLHSMTLRNDPGLFDDLLNELYVLGILPGTTTGKSIQFEPVAGSWREVNN